MLDPKITLDIDMIDKLMIYGTGLNNFITLETT